MKKTIFKRFTQLYGGRPDAVPAASADHPATIQEGSENGVRRHLVQVVLRDLLRRHGIPSEWIECRMLIVSSRTRGSGMFVRLVVQHWDERLMNYASAFQKELIAEITQFEPKAASWLHGVSWQLEVDGSCPYTTLPGRAFWLEPKAEATSAISATATATSAAGEAMQVRPAIPVSVVKPEQHRPQDERQEGLASTQELEHLFAIRDRELDAQADHHGLPTDYEKTQPAPL